MGIGTSIFFVAVGAILAFAVDVHVQGLDIKTVGLILLVVGGIGILLSMIFWSSWGGFHRRDIVVDGGSGARRRVIEQDI